MDVASVFHETLNKVVNPPRPDTLLSSVPEDKSELPQLHFREVQWPLTDRGFKTPPIGMPKVWVVILRDEFGAVTDQIEESVVEDRPALESRFRRLWADLLQNRSHAHMHKINEDRKMNDEETVEEPALPVKEDLELTMQVASETFKMLESAEVTVEYRGVKITLRR